MNNIFGIAKFIDLNTFSDPWNGYLIDDTCVFGVEVFVVENSFKEECLSMMQEPIMYYHTWTVIDFSRNGEGKGNSISISLNVSRSSSPQGTELFVKFLLQVKDQINGKHIEREGDYLFTSSNKYPIGWHNFMSLAKLKDSKQGYLMDDTLIIDAEVTLLGLVITKS
ncbi:hypothetical protein Q3G72_029756 [Acer saccharum]|nr:hypothetical protein Q3G72_029756 [Acer saccharum]